MATIPLTDRLRAEYDDLFSRCIIRPERSVGVQATLAAIDRHRPRYEAVESRLGVPWHFVAVVHAMESSLDFSKHLHNGDPLTARTVQAPAGRPKGGAPPFSWEESAADALTIKRLDQWSDWSAAGTLYRLEGYNGYGYRLYHPEVPSPYLWSFSSLYTSGKYVKDGVWSPSARSLQCGAAVLLRRMAELGRLTFGVSTPAAAPAPAAAAPMIAYSSQVVPGALELQEFLNRLPGLYVKPDGKPGKRTSEALRKATGHYLSGDPRET